MIRLADDTQIAEEAIAEAAALAAHARHLAFRARQRAILAGCAVAVDAILEGLKAEAAEVEAAVAEAAAKVKTARDARAASVAAN